MSLFLSFEGGEASGKSVQAQRLVARLTAAGHDVLLTREPGGTPLGERIREVVLHTRDLTFTPEAEALLFTTARAQLTRDVIRPALARGAIVIADRFFDSTFAYQGHGRGADLAGLQAITRFAVGDTRPDRTFVLDVPVDVAFARRREPAQWDRIEAAERSFHERLRTGYLELAAAEPGRIVVIRGDRDEETVAGDIARAVDAVLVPSRE